MRPFCGVSLGWVTEDDRLGFGQNKLTRIEQIKGSLFKDPYCWILKNANFQRWHYGDDQQGRLLWIKGDPGKGKTILLCSIVDELKSTIGDGVLFYFAYQQRRGYSTQSDILTRRPPTVPDFTCAEEVQSCGQTAL